MIHLHRIHLLFLVILQCTFSGLPAAVAGDADVSAAGSRDEATVHFQQGIEYYKQHNFEAASIEFGRAYELKPSYKILYNIAQAENMLEHYAAALTAYRTYMEQGGDEIPTDRRTTVTDEINRLLTRVGYVEVIGAADGAAILIDGEEKGTTPLTTPITVDIGKREVEITADTTRLFRRIYPIAGGQRVVVNLSPTPTGAAASNADTPATEGSVIEDSSEATDTSFRPQSKPRKIAGALLLGIGLSAAVSGAVTGGIALSKRKDIEKNCDGNQCDADTWGDEFDTVQHLSISTDVLLGAAVASVTAGILLLVIKPTRENTRSVSAGVMPLENGAFAAVSGRF